MPARDVVIIDLFPPQIQCWVCGACDLSRWGIPIYEGRILRNEDEGEWGGVPACERCYSLHQAGDIDRLYELHRAATKGGSIS